MTFKDYELRMVAYNHKMIDKERDMHWQAFLNHTVTSTKETRDGKSYVPVYPTFNDFFDYAKVEESVFGKKGKGEIEEVTAEDLRKEKLRSLMLKANT